MPLPSRAVLSGALLSRILEMCSPLDLLWRLLLVNKEFRRLIMTDASAWPRALEMGFVPEERCSLTHWHRGHAGR